MEPVKETVLVVAAPRSYFVEAPRSQLMDKYGAEARFTPQSAMTYRVGGMLVGYVAGALPVTLLTIWFVGLVNGIVIGTTVGSVFALFMWNKGFESLVLPRFPQTRPIWALRRVEKTFEWQPEYEEVDDGEGNSQSVLVDVTWSETTLPAPLYQPVTPRALMLEARATGDPQDRGIQRADYLYLALKPTDIIEWFKHTAAGLGKPDLFIGAGYVVMALAVVMLFVLTQTDATPTAVPNAP